MRAAIYCRVSIVVLALLAIALLLACAGVSQDEYDMVKADLDEVKAKVADLQAELRTEQAKVTEFQKQLQGYRTEIAKIERELEVFQAQIPKPVAERTVTDCVEPMNVAVRDKAVSVVASAPSRIDANSEAWKIWQINYWVSENITYVSDPKGQEYLAYANETLETRAGDCDDFSILLASMYESVGLDAAIAYIDTGDEKEDHMTCLVYWLGDSQSFLDEEQLILEQKKLKNPTGKTLIRFWNTETPQPSLGKYDAGIWIIADPLMAEVKGMVGYLTCEPYVIVAITDVGE